MLGLILRELCPFLTLTFCRDTHIVEGSVLQTYISSCMYDNHRVAKIPNIHSSCMYDYHRVAKIPNIQHEISRDVVCLHA